MHNFGRLTDEFRQRTKCTEPLAEISDAAIWSALQRIVAETLGIQRELVTREARFCEDLGAD